jgi:hypothetical protein
VAAEEGEDGRRGADCVVWLLCLYGEEAVARGLSLGDLVLLEEQVGS